MITTEKERRRAHRSCTRTRRAAGQKRKKPPWLVRKLVCSFKNERKLHFDESGILICSEKLPGGGWLTVPLRDGEQFQAESLGFKLQGEVTFDSFVDGVVIEMTSTFMGGRPGSTCTIIRHCEQSDRLVVQMREPEATYFRYYSRVSGP